MKIWKTRKAFLSDYTCHVVLHELHTSHRSSLLVMFKDWSIMCTIINECNLFLFHPLSFQPSFHGFCPGEATKRNTMLSFCVGLFFHKELEVPIPAKKIQQKSPQNENLNCKHTVTVCHWFPQYLHSLVSSGCDCCQTCRLLQMVLYMYQLRLLKTIFVN